MYLDIIDDLQSHIDNGDEKSETVTSCRAFQQASEIKEEQKIYVINEYVLCGFYLGVNLQE